MEKVKAVLPKEVADGIEHIQRNHKLGFVYDLEGIGKEMERHGEPYQAVLRFATHSRDNMIIYFHALVDGYELEQTPEEKVRDYFDKQYSKLGNYSQDNSAYAIRNTLDLLGIKIEGVNA